MEELWSKISGLITADNVALLSVIITVLIFVISRRAEIRYKKHDDKKVQYLKLIDLMQQMLSNPKKDKKGELVLSDETRRLFFDTEHHCFYTDQREYIANTYFFGNSQLIL